MNHIHLDTFFTFYIIAVFVISIVLFRLFEYFSHSFGVREFQKTELTRWNPQYKPSVGGFVFYTIFLLIMIVSTLLLGIPDSNKLKLIGWWGATTIAFFMGFADDTFNTQPLIKAIAQIICALVLILSGTYIHFFQNHILNHFLTIIWVVGIMNSINMLDNMDGIAGSMALYILLFILIVMYHTNTNIFSATFLINAGISTSLFAFLLFNFYPSKIFMGDTGSQFLGIILSSNGIEYIWNLPLYLPNMNTNLIHILLIALVYLVLLTDTTTVTINRLLAGGSPFIGGKDHTTHYLCQRGINERAVFYILSGISITALFLAYQIIFHFSLVWFYISILYISISFLFLYLNTKLFWSEKK